MIEALLMPLKGSCPSDPWRSGTVTHTSTRISADAAAKPTERCHDQLTRVCARAPRGSGLDHLRQLVKITFRHGKGRLPLQIIQPYTFFVHDYLYFLSCEGLTNENANSLIRVVQKILYFFRSPMI